MIAAEDVVLITCPTCNGEGGGTQFGSFDGQGQLCPDICPTCDGERVVPADLDDFTPCAQEWLCHRDLHPEGESTVRCGTDLFHDADCHDRAHPRCDR